MDLMNEVASVKIWFTVEGHCECGIVHPIGFQPECLHYMECDWGVLENPEADPRKGLQPLMLATCDYVEELLAEGPKENRYGGTDDAFMAFDLSQQVTKMFARVDYQGVRTTWELTPAYFDDLQGPNVFIGRWRD